MMSAIADYISSLPAFSAEIQSALNNYVTTQHPNSKACRLG